MARGERRSRPRAGFYRSSARHSAGHRASSSKPIVSMKATTMPLGSEFPARLRRIAAARSPRHSRNPTYSTRACRWRQSPPGAVTTRLCCCGATPSACERPMTRSWISSALYRKARYNKRSVQIGSARLFGCHCVPDLRSRIAVFSTEEGWPSGLRHQS
jgi:hypothetical protein